MFFKKIILLLLVSSIFTGCANFMNGERDNTLQATLFAYQSALRWGQWSDLSRYRNSQAAPMPNLAFDNIRITAYEIRQPPVPIQEDRVLQVVEIQYVLGDEQRLRRVFDKQDWRYNAETSQWSLYSPFPELR